MSAARKPQESHLSPERREAVALALKGAAPLAFVVISSILYLRNPGSKISATLIGGAVAACMMLVSYALGEKDPLGDADYGYESSSQSSYESGSESGNSDAGSDSGG